MSRAARRPVSRARPQEIRRSDGLSHKRVVAAINLDSHRPAAAASPTGSGITATSSPPTTAFVPGCRSTSSTSCRRRRATARATLLRAPTASVGIPGAAAPRGLRARAERPLFVHIFINDLLLWYLLTASSSMAFVGRPPNPPTPHSESRPHRGSSTQAHVLVKQPQTCPRRLPRCALKAHCIMCIM